MKLKMKNEKRNAENRDCPLFLGAVPIFCLYIFAFSFFVNVVYAGDYKSFRGNITRTGAVNEQAYQPSGTTLTEKWKISKATPFISSPIVYKNNVYIGNIDGNLYVYDYSTGQEKFYVSLNGKIISTPCAYNDIIYIPSQDGNLYALDYSTGALKWKYATGSKDCSSPVIYNNKLYCATGFPNKYIYCLKVSDGSLVWQKNVDQYTYSSPLFKNSLIYIGSNDGKIRCLDADTGEEKWYFQTKGGVYMSTASVLDNIVYFAPGNDDLNVYALDTSTKALKTDWQLNSLSDAIPIVISSIAVADSVVYVGCGGIDASLVHYSKLFALDSSTGAIKWQVTLDIISNIGFASSPVVANDIIYIGSVIGVDSNSDSIIDSYTGGKLYEIDVSNGSIIQQVTLDAPVVSSPVVSNGWVYVATGLDSSGSLYAFQMAKACAISYPEDSSTISGDINVLGFAKNSDMSGYKLEYKLASSSAWTTINAANSQVEGGTLGTLNTASLPEDSIQLKLTITDTNSNARRSTSLVSLTLNNTYLQATISAASGGVMTSADGTQLIFEPGALKEDDTVTINKPTEYSTGSLATGYKATSIVREFTVTKAANAVFNKLVTVKIPYTDSGVTGMTKANLRICFWDSTKSKWQILHSSSPLTSENKVMGKVSHFSIYRIFEYTPGLEALIDKETTYSYPNPALGDTVVFKCYLGDDADITIDVFDVAGDRIASFTNTGIAGMSLESRWDVTNIASAVYIYKVEAVSKRTGERKYVIKKQAIVH
jgi:outer membrane protein assembly factor BamB